MWAMIKVWFLYRIHWYPLILLISQKWVWHVFCSFWFLDCLGSIFWSIDIHILLLSFSVSSNWNILANPGVFNTLHLCEMENFHQAESKYCPPKTFLAGTWKITPSHFLRKLIKFFTIHHPSSMTLGVPNLLLFRGSEVFVNKIHPRKAREVFVNKIHQRKARKLGLQLPLSGPLLSRSLTHLDGWEDGQVPPFLGDAAAPTRQRCRWSGGTWGGASVGSGMLEGEALRRGVATGRRIWRCPTDLDI